MNLLDIVACNLLNGGSTSGDPSIGIDDEARSSSNCRGLPGAESVVEGPSTESAVSTVNGSLLDREPGGRDGKGNECSKKREGEKHLD
jgi:hypothetical protein